MANVIDKELIHYFVMLDEQQKKSLLEMMKSFLNPGKDPLQPVTIEEYNQDLDQAMQRISQGEFLTLEQLEKEMESW